MPHIETRVERFAEYWPQAGKELKSKVFGRSVNCLDIFRYFCCILVKKLEYWNVFWGLLWCFPDQSCIRCQLSKVWVRQLFALLDECKLLPYLAGSWRCGRSKMTKKSKGRLNRDRLGIPQKKKIAHIEVDHIRKTQFILTNDMLLNQIQRDGPRVARSFDRLAEYEIAECSKIFSSVQGALLRHLPKIDDNGFKATSARLLSSASNSYVASIEVARHGFPLQYGSLARMVVEALATVLALATRAEAIEQFHAGKLKSTKCVTWAKESLPILPPLWGMLSNEFVHIGRGHSTLDMPKRYKSGDEALGFIKKTMMTMACLLQIVTELIYADEKIDLLFWKPSGGGWTFDPSPESARWMDEHLS